MNNSKIERDISALPFLSLKIWKICNRLQMYVDLYLNDNILKNFEKYLLTYMGVFGFGFEATYRPIRQLIYDKWHLGR